MDKKRALQVLGLGPGATAVEAKQVYRSLAKAFHPDRFARNPAGAQSAEARMKEINQAFYFLVPLLDRDNDAGASPRRESDTPPSGDNASDSPPKASADSASRRKPDRAWPGFFSSFGKRWKRTGRPRTRVRSTPNSSKKGEAGYSRPRPKRAASRKKVRFDSLLNGIEPGMTGPSTGKRVETKGSPTTAYANYCRHMAVKKRVQHAKNRSRVPGTNRVEKISPVRRVDPVGR